MEKQMKKEETKPTSESASKESTGKESIEGLPFEDSPYLKYKDLEDYKRQGYGTEGHQEPKEGRGAGSTEAPTLSGANVSSEAQVTVADAANRKGVP